jgi:hypothetical protein|tara:strand:+ start:210 stop:455 length:246 start_codon:yes stop_codon:yes gene_type:complete
MVISLLLAIAEPNVIVTVSTTVDAEMTLCVIVIPPEQVQDVPDAEATVQIPVDATNVTVSPTACPSVAVILKMMPVGIAPA